MIWFWFDSCLDPRTQNSGFCFCTSCLRFPSTIRDNINFCYSEDNYQTIFSKLCYKRNVSILTASFSSLITQSDAYAKLTSDFVYKNFFFSAPVQSAPTQEYFSQHHKDTLGQENEKQTYAMLTSHNTSTGKAHVLLFVQDDLIIITPHFW